MKKFELSIDHPLLKGAKQGFDACLKAAITRAITTGSMEGSATVRVSFEIGKTQDADTGEISMSPDFRFKAGYSVPMKDSIDGKVIELSKIVEKDGQFALINGQISMDELMEDDAE